MFRTIPTHTPEGDCNKGCSSRNENWNYSTSHVGKQTRGSVGSYVHRKRALCVNLLDQGLLWLVQILRTISPRCFPTGNFSHQNHQLPTFQPKGFFKALVHSLVAIEETISSKTLPNQEIPWKMKHSVETSVEIFSGHKYPTESSLCV